ncbi:enamine deaminase RidA (YjgF/YER057c/UK114 family) [Catenuloplanes nepalensis]|uniref:Enamine deaminase RidA (YjgF/YER057c/UK114 family) n=1 Tax=Catenuloplanes nepalensis TaxID=587533 RepID=A0ABT9MPJ1_9ACTN|nr:Rid family hydrolase [Catenuloplanes nepalensis]MDP9793344.1 enamine deaminase RidA (YjgF/YER057c/UK114 family) [Catenuloplanes nepalensis]
MAVTLINPPGLPNVPVYHHVSVATGSRFVHVAGQVSWDANGTNIAVGDLAGQVEQAYLNVTTALGASGATWDDVVKLVVHVVDWTPEKMPLLLDGIDRAKARLGITATPPASLFGIATLDVPEHLVEIEATAITD